MPASFFRLLYRSRFNAGRVDSPLTMLRDIVKVSARNNAGRDITGFLLFDGEHFLQVLEGEEGQVRETYERIAKDPRHRELEMLAEERIATRGFANWAMGGHLRGSQDSEIFARHGAEERSIANLDADRALPLVIELAQRAADRAPR